MRVRTIAAAMALFLCTAGAFAANPAYDSWASHKPGTMVVMKGGTEASGMKTEMEQTYTLKEVTPEKVTIEMKNSMMVMGNKTDMPATTMEIPSGGAATPAPTPAPATPAADTKTSEETVTIDGKDYKATCTETKMDQNGMKSDSKIWTSPDMPGMTVKMETKTEGQMASTTTMMVSKVEIK